MPGDFHLWRVLSTVPNWRDYVEWSPHFHIIGVGEWFEQGTGADGVVFKGVSELKGAEAVLKCSMYLLSHTGAVSEVSPDRGVQVVRWFGALSPANWSLGRASPAVQRAVRGIIRAVLQRFARQEGAGPMAECTQCGTPLVEMYELPKYLNLFEGDVLKQLIRAYLWWYSGKSPPRGLSEEEVWGWVEWTFQVPWGVDLEVWAMRYANGANKSERFLPWRPRPGGGAGGR